MEKYNTQGDEESMAYWEQLEGFARLGVQRPVELVCNNGRY